MSFYTKKRGLLNLVNDTTTLFLQHSPVEENAVNLSQKRSEPLVNNGAREPVGYLQPRKIQESHTRNSSAQKIHSMYPDGVTLINLNNNRGPHIMQSQNHDPRKNVHMQFYTNPRIDLHIPIDKLHFSPTYHNILHPRTFQNLGAINNLKIDFTVGPNQLGDKQIKEEPIKTDVCINFQDICVLLDVLVTRIKWNFKHMLDSINTHAKISVNDYWRDEGHLKFKLCLTDVINIIEEIKKLNFVLYTQCQSPKELQADELTQELEAFIKRSRKMFVAEMQETLRSEYVKYCEDFFNNQLKLLFLEHKRKYRAIFERILTENYRRNLKSMCREDDVAKVEKTTKMVESATQTFTDPPTQTSKAVNGIKTIKNKSPQNMFNNYVTITQCPKSSSNTQIDKGSLKPNTKLPSSLNLIQEVKEANKRMTDKRKVTDTVIITPKYPIKADLPDLIRIKNSSEGRVSYCETDSISKRKKNVIVTDCTSRIKKRKLSCEIPKHSRTEIGESIIVIDSDREETCNNMQLNVDDSNVISFKSKESERMATKRDFTKLKHDTNNYAERNKNNTVTNQVKVRAGELVKSRQVELEITPTIKINTKANNEELKQSNSIASNVNKKFRQVRVLENITQDNFDKKELSTQVHTSSSPSQQKSLVRTSIINFINKNSLREKCTKSKVKVHKQFEETVHSSDQESDKVITSRPNNSSKQTMKESPFIGPDLDHNRLKNSDGNESKNQAGMGFVQQIHGLEVKHHLTPEEYVNEVMAVDKMNIPIVFKRFYTYVTRQQILQQVNPISFKLFLELFNNGGLRNFYRKYTDYQKKHEVV